MPFEGIRAVSLSNRSNRAPGDFLNYPASTSS